MIMTLAVHIPRPHLRERVGQVMSLTEAQDHSITF